MQAAQRRYLSLCNYTDLQFWDYHTLSPKNKLIAKYPLVELSNVLKLRKAFITIEDTKEYKRCRVQIQGRGVILRDLILGKDIKTKKQQLCKKDDFLVAEIDAKVGGYGIVPDSLEEAIVSGHYFLFEIEKSLLTPEYLAIVVQQQQFAKQVKSTGSTNYAAIRPYHVLGYKIPLPPLYEQEKLATNYTKKLHQAEQLKLTVKKLEDEIERYFLNELGINKNSINSLNKGLNLIEYSSLTKWSLNYLNRNDDYDFTISNFKTEKIKNILTLFEGGKTPSKSVPAFWSGSICWTSPKDFYGQHKLIRSEDSISEVAVKETGIKIYPKGVFLSVFRSGILQHSFPTVITHIETAINQDLKAYAFDKSMVNDSYYLYFVRVFQKYFLNRACKKSVTVESINTEDFIEIDIPIPPMNIQDKIAIHVEEINEEIKSQKEKIEMLKQQAQQEFEKAIFS